ncbi:hypothetical protein L2E82_51385 [Cichorium intybus]|nr:hypothetical protein L2E82_51385 [Cichorium intybus]
MLFDNSVLSLYDFMALSIVTEQPPTERPQFTYPCLSDGLLLDSGFILDELLCPGGKGVGCQVNGVGGRGL